MDWERRHISSSTCVLFLHILLSAFAFCFLPFALTFSRLAALYCASLIERDVCHCCLHMNHLSNESVWTQGWILLRNEQSCFSTHVNMCIL